ncbi:hypothetical protein SAMN05216297_110202 [Flavobacterium phragmitis]|uniref:Uncharacterized protein n=1 Tax=Flavobacterium phragmitis TaxID=739143 RepID=A0A1I1U5A0_9FLAO|nr:hypothetical protein SAMN05216297_110202 [Flavobacterium phragmitis]
MYQKNVLYFASQTNQKNLISQKKEELETKYFSLSIK